MTTPAQTPDLESLAKQYGGVSSDQPVKPAPTQVIPQSAPQAQATDLESLAKQYGAVDGTTETQSKFAPYDAASFGRFTTPENYEKWASIPPKSGVDAKAGEYEAWTSANSPEGAMGTLKDSLRPLPYAALAGGTALGVTAIPEVLPSVLIHTVAGVKALGQWAEAHPYKAFMLYQVAKELLPNAKKAMGLIKAVPEVAP